MSSNSTLIVETVERLMETLRESGLTPAEGDVAVELVTWNLMENKFKIAQDEAQVNAAKLGNVRMLTRLMTRSEAWPANTLQRN